jgi:hypothetical protein
VSNENFKKSVCAEYPQAAVSRIEFTPDGAVDQAVRCVCWVVSRDVLPGSPVIGCGDTEVAAWSDAANKLSRYWYPEGVPEAVVGAATFGVNLLIITIVVACWAWGDPLNPNPA